MWVPHDTRDAVVDYVRHWKDRSGIPAKQIVAWLGIQAGKFYDWKQRYGKVNEHNGWIPRDHWLTPDEKQAILAFHHQHPLEGYRRLTFMMLDADVVAASPASVYRVLKAADVIGRSKTKRLPRARASSSRRSRTATGTSISATSTSAGPFTTCAAYWMATVGTYCTGRFAKRCWRKTSKSYSSELVRSTPTRRHGSSPTTGRSSSPRTSNSLSASVA